MLKYLHSVCKASPSFFLLCFLTYFPVLIYSQKTQTYFPYYQFINQAELAAANEHYPTADSLYQKAFLVVNHPFSQDLFLASLNAQKLENPTQCQSYLLSAFAHGLKLKQVKDHPLLYPYLKSHKLKSKVIKSYKKKRKKYTQTLNLNLKKQLEELIKKDQKVRSGKYNKMPWKQQQQLMKTVDSLSFLELLQICKTQEFPGYQTIGENRTGKYDVEDFAFLMRHMHEEELTQLRPYILKAISEGQLSPWEYASALDYTSMFKTTIEDRDEDGHPILIVQQIYGTITFTNKERNAQLFHVKNIATANQLRKEIGLEPVEEEAKKRKALPPEEGIYKKVFK